MSDDRPGNATADYVRACFDSASDALLGLEVDGIITCANSTAARLLGQSDATELVGLSVQTFVETGDLANAAASDRVMRLRVPIDGSAVGRVHAITTADGVVGFTLRLSPLVTPPIQAKVESAGGDQRAYQTWLERAIKELPTAVCMADPVTGRYILSNDAFDRMLGGRLTNDAPNPVPKHSLIALDPETNRRLDVTEFPAPRAPKGTRRHRVPFGARGAGGVGQRFRIDLDH